MTQPYETFNFNYRYNDVDSEYSQWQAVISGIEITSGGEGSRDTRGSHRTCGSCHYSFHCRLRCNDDDECRLMVPILMLSLSRFLAQPGLLFLFRYGWAWGTVE